MRCPIPRVLFCSVYLCQPAHLRRPSVDLDPQVFPSRTVSPGLPWSMQSKCKQVPDDLQTQLLSTAAKPSQSGENSEPWHGPASEERVACPRPLSQSKLPLSGNVKTKVLDYGNGKGATSHCGTFTSGHQFPHIVGCIYQCTRVSSRNGNRRAWLLCLLLLSTAT